MEKNIGKLAGEISQEHVSKTDPNYAWNPQRYAPMIGACVSGGLTALGFALAAPPIAPLTLLGAFVAGCGAGLASYFGIKSAGIAKR